MDFLKRLALMLLPAPILLWAKKQYYSYVVPKFWEPEVEPIKCFVRPGDSVLDLGANFGWYTATLSRMVGDTGRVYSVEPIPETFAVLSSVAESLGLKNAELFNCALSDHCGSAVMEVPKFAHGGKNFYMAHIVSGKSSDPSLESFEVPLRSLDSVLSGKKPERVTFVKCDVEGHELAVLKGAANFLACVKPAMLVEVTGTAEMQDAPDHEFHGMMRGFGYQPYWFDGKSLRKRVKGHSCVNYFFLQPEHIVQVAHLIAE
jgi:FkbM family methyltransferase